MSGVGARIATDTVSLLRLDSRKAQLLLAFYGVANMVFVVMTADLVRSPWVSLTAVLLVMVAASLLIQPGTDPFPLRESWFVVAVVVLTTTMVSWNLPVEGELGRATWHQGANAWLLFFMSIRRRSGLAWLGFGLMTAITAAWGLSSGRGALTAVLMLQSHAATLVVAALFGSGLHRAAREINAFAELTEQAAEASAMTQARREIRRRRATEVREIASRPLERIVAGESFDESDRREIGATEAALRDLVRARGLTSPAIVTAASAARRRGVDVTLLDDRSTTIADGDVMTRLSHAVARFLDDADDGAVTVRLLPEGRHALVTGVAQAGDSIVRLELDDAGAPVELEAPAGD
ncbi:hypothetical protein [Demequina salsinemoris]|uniref:hypothetical protein n=1 Tax=Demequina salsinemoris TaxID=577470 RepID=UPI000781CC87|nr:hypothetical protein [Demequina salsinemoris]